MPEIIMPRLSDTMEEGTLSRWFKQEGDQVHKGDVLAEIETDKAAMELEAYDEGTLTRILVREGDTVPIGTPVAIIGEESAAPAEGRESGGGESGAPPAEARPEEGEAEGASGRRPDETAAARQPAEAEASPAEGRAEAGSADQAVEAGDGRRAAPAEKAGGEHEAPRRIRTSPLARRIARDHGIDLGTITGSGPGGRIVRADVDEAIARKEKEAAPASAPAPAPAAAPAEPEPRPRPVARETEAPRPAAEDVEEVPLNRVRRLTAQRLTRSSQEAPHFYLTSVVDAEPLLAHRAEINAALADSGLKVSVNDLIIKACAVMLREHPAVNASWDETRILRHRRVHIGLAVALDDGLVVPVVHDADRKTLSEIAAEAHDLAERARAGRLSLDEMSGGTFTISNLGPYGIDHFTAVINPPQAAILAVGAAKPEPVVRDGEVRPGVTMAMTLSVDHRVLDGATGAAFLRDLKRLLEQPLRIVL